MVVESGWWWWWWWVCEPLTASIWVCEAETEGGEAHEAFGKGHMRLGKRRGVGWRHEVPRWWWWWWSVHVKRSQRRSGGLQVFG